ncbi:unnamed protein product [Brassica oleracea]
MTWSPLCFFVLLICSGCKGSLGMLQQRKFSVLSRGPLFPLDQDAHPKLFFTLNYLSTHD